MTRSRIIDSLRQDLTFALRTLGRNKGWTAVAVITLVRPDWALRSRQRAELLLGERLYLRLQRMEEPERLQVLKSLWVEAPPTSD